MTLATSRSAIALLWSLAVTSVNRSMATGGGSFVVLVVILGVTVSVSVSVTVAIFGRIMLCIASAGFVVRPAIIVDTRVMWVGITLLLALVIIASVIVLFSVGVVAVGPTTAAIRTISVVLVVLAIATQFGIAVAFGVRVMVIKCTSFIFRWINLLILVLFLGYFFSFLLFLVSGFISIKSKGS